MLHSYEPATSRTAGDRARLIAVHVLAAIALGGVLVLGFGALVMLLWNATLPALLGAHVITYWQSVGLLLLARVLVGGWHHGRRDRNSPSYLRHAKRRQFDQWWKESGEHSFRTFEDSQPKPQN